jgi:hypothetical protein
VTCTVLAFCLSIAAQIPPENKAKPQPARSVPLLVTADLNCTLMVDGVSQGILKRDEIKEVQVSPGEHLVRAISTEGLDKWQAPITIDRLQKTLQIPLAAIREAREEKEHKESTERKREEEDKREEEQRREQRNRVAWTDATTRLMWTRQDNGYSLDWNQARNYCRDLDLAGYRDWRLPTINELAGIYDPRQDANSENIKGEIRVSKNWFWSSSVGTSSLEGSGPEFADKYNPSRSSQRALSFGFTNGGKYSAWVDESYMQRALCVRHLAE